MNILLVEDNQSITKGLIYSLESNNYKVFSTSTIKETKDFLNTNPEITLAILDVLLPDGNTFDLYENTISKLNIPVIFLTAKDDENDIVKGLNMGAEDYLTKPFSTKELLARINKIVLRNKKQSIIEVKDIKYNVNKMVFYKNSQEINLTSLELKILNLLFQNLNKVVTRNTILDKIWEWTGNDVDDYTITVYFKRIREKIGTDIITTIKGIGYRIDYEEQN
ncbi:MAG TPA: DNA-binding response regulator [Firmicutes bacterium]|nr:DNA-binding response regulator [Bacillota bacterium]